MKLQAVDPGFQCGAGAHVRADAAGCPLRGRSTTHRVLRSAAAAPARAAGRARRLRGHGTAAQRDRTSSSRSKSKAGRRFLPHNSRRWRSGLRRPTISAPIGIPLKRGRAFTEADRAGTPRVVLITESAARQFFPNEDPIGKTIKLGWGRGPGKPRAGGEVVGIVGDVKDAGLDEPNPPQIYMPLRQWPVGFMSVVLKTATPPTSLADAARGEVYAVDSNLPVSNVRTLDEIVAQLDFAAAVLHVAADHLCRRRTRARRNRDLRRAVLCGCAANA